MEPPLPFRKCCCCDDGRNAADDAVLTLATCIVSTGTPAGVGRITDGDTVVVEIDNVGRLVVTVSSAGAIACPTRSANRGPKPRIR